MITLKEEEGKAIRMYSFETEREMETWMFGDFKEIFSGTKSDLLLKDESFWKEIVESSKPHVVWYKDYQSINVFSTAKESGESAYNLEPGEWKIIVEEKI